MYVPNVVPTAARSAPAPADPSSAAVLDNILLVDVDMVRLATILALGRDLMAALENNMVKAKSLMDMR